MADRADERALLIYDGDCAFCRYWVEAWRHETGDRVIHAAAEEIAEKFPEIPRGRYRRSIQLIDVDGRRYEGAQAAFRALAHAPGKGWLRALYDAPLVAPLSEAVYRLVARHRDACFRATKLLWGPKPTGPRYGMTAWIFLRALALVYLVAFLSWMPQLPGLVGPDGIMPNGSPAATYQLVALAGAGAALAAFAGYFVGPALLAAWLAYAAVTNGAGEFADFQWDRLLLEAGFLALLIAPFRRARVADGRVEASSTMVWLFRFLLFRVLFLSGLAKLLFGDASWTSLSALRNHLETQPLPTPLAWHAARLPEGVLKAATFGALLVEIVVPFLFFMPRRARLAGAGIASLYLLVVVATGNYAFFGFLALALCLLLLDDAVLERVFALKARAKAAAAPYRRFETAFAAVIVVLAVAQAVAMFRPASRSAAALASLASSLRVVSAYSLFATTLPTREEVVIEGSDDGVAWKPYGFLHKPGDVKRKPSFVAPFHPRLDWHLWYAAVTPLDANPWFPRLMVKLLQGSEPVLALFGENPFPDGPPAHVRATLYRYRFTTPEERARDGAWWRAAMRIELLPPMTVSSFVSRPSE